MIKKKKKLKGALHLYFFTSLFMPGGYVKNIELINELTNISFAAVEKLFSLCHLIPDPR